MSKRGGIFGQGKPEDPYNEREESPVDTPKQATAAQLASRKLKVAKPRRPAGVTSGLSATPPPNAFGGLNSPSFGGFGGANNNNNNTGAFGNSAPQGQNNGGFGTGTSSFPPTQPSSQGNLFSNSSFPAPSFGGNDTNTGFNPQPPTSTFNFGTTVTNPFGQNASAPTAATNGSGAGGFGGIFNTPAAQPQPQGLSNPFGGVGQSSAPAAASSSIFGTSSAPTAASSNIFGTSSTPAAASSNVFGTSSAPAASSSIFGTSSAPAAASSNLFGTSSTNTASAAPAAPAVQETGNTSWGFTQSSQAQQSGAGPQSTGFAFGNPASNSSATSSAPASGPMFGTSTTSRGFSFTGDADKTPAAKSLFSFPSAGTLNTSNGPPLESANSAFGSDSGKTVGDKMITKDTSSPFAFDPKSSVATPKQSTSFGANFGTSNTSTAAPTTSTSAPLFAFSATSGASTQAQTSSTPATAGNLFGTSTQAQSSSTPVSAGNAFGVTPKANNTAASTSITSQARPTNPFGALNTPAGTKDTPAKSLFESKSSSAANSQSSTGTGLFSQLSTPISQNSDSSKGQPFSLFPKKADAESAKPKIAQAPAFAFPPNKSSSVSNENNKDVATPKPTLSSMFSKSISPPKDPAPLSPASAMPTLTGAAAAPPNVPEKPSIPTMRVPKNWPSASVASSDIVELGKQLAFVNGSYRAKLANLPLTADWSALSLWHQKETSDIIKRISELKKQAATAKGVTGNESSLSVKRKAGDDVNRDTHDGSPTKKQRPADVPKTPVALKSIPPMTTTPKATPPASQTSSIFGNAISKGAMAGSATADKASEPTKTVGFQSPFGNTNTNTVESAKKDLFQSPFQVPKSLSAGSKSGFQVPNFGAGSKATSGGSTDFMAQFGSSSKTAEQMRAERKAKDKDEDYDSDEETEEAWSARWDKEEAERVAKEQEKLKASSIPALKSSAPQKSAADGPSASSIFGSISGASSPGLFGSRNGSPAPSNGLSNSVFDTPAGATTPTQMNIFGHLSSGQSSNDQDEEDDEGDEGDDESQSKVARPSKRKLDTHSESESDSEDATKRLKGDTAKKPSLLDRITRADPSEIEAHESEKENNKPQDADTVPGQTNGLQTPAQKAKFTFDFAAAGGQTAPPKQATFAGDQTFKAGTPIKFGTATKAPSGAPTFQFQPATPSAADLSTTPSKPPPSTFAFLNAGNDLSSNGSAVSSRAPTPLSEAGSAAGSTAGDDDDEGSKSEQLNLSALTDEEKTQHDVLFTTDQAVAKHQVAKDGEKKWESYARGALWILKNKETGKAIVRMRLSSGATRLNYAILPKLDTKLAGGSQKMVAATGIKEDGKPFNLFFCFRTTEIAKEFSSTYNENIR